MVAGGSARGWPPGWQSNVNRPGIIKDSSISVQSGTLSQSLKNWLTDPSSAPTTVIPTSPGRDLSSASTSRHQCKICGKILQDVCALQYHHYTHTGERPFRCSQCDKTFTQRGHLQNHMYIHSGRKHFWCPICHMPFIQRQTCRDHVRNHHKTDPRDFPSHEYKRPDDDKDPLDTLAS